MKNLALVLTTLGLLAQRRFCRRDVGEDRDHETDGKTTTRTKKVKHKTDGKGNSSVKTETTDKTEVK